MKAGIARPSCSRICGPCVLKMRTIRVEMPCMVPSGAMFSRCPVTKLSMQMTSQPVPRMNRARCEPRKPAPPVMRILIAWSARSDREDRTTACGARRERGDLVRNVADAGDGADFHDGASSYQTQHFRQDQHRVVERFTTEEGSCDGGIVVVRLVAVTCDLRAGVAHSVSQGVEMLAGDRDGVALVSRLP